MSEQTRAIHPIYNLLPTEIEGFDALAERHSQEQNPKKPSPAPNPRQKRIINKRAGDDRLTELPAKLQRIGIAADHGGYELKEYLVGKLRGAGHGVLDFGDSQPKADDDYPDFVVPLARAVAAETVDRGIAICGSGVGASVCANKVAGVRACLIHETFSAHLRS